MFAGQSAAADRGGKLRQAEPSPILISYDFEQSKPSGPDTFRLFERADGSVDLSHAFRVSGDRSLRIREVPENGTFTEFLGFFPRRDSGHVCVQFYLLLTDPEEEMQFGVAGPHWFLSPEPGGQAFWLEGRDGVWSHWPDGERRELLLPKAFTWYFFDWVYDVDRGTYDLAIWEEGLEEAVVDLEDQPNLGGVPRSPVEFYSFIGDFEDRGRVTYFVDDVLVASDPAIRFEPFVAPGRRRFFVEGGEAPAPLSDHDLEDRLWEAREFVRSQSESVAPALAGRLERAADEAFHLRDLDLAEALYGILGRDSSRAGRMLLKRADVYFLRGDLDAERAAREAIYGRLEIEGEE